MNYQMTNLEKEVQALYSSLNIINPSQLDFHLIANKLNLPLFIGKWESKAMKYRGKHMIVLNENLSKSEQWEVFGHELCHILKHTGNQLVIPHSFRELQEAQANNFMFHFCVPTFMLLKINFPSYRNRGIKLIADTFNVTIPFAQKRLERYENQIFGLSFYKALEKVNTDELYVKEPGTIDLHEDIPFYQRSDFKEYLNLFPEEERELVIKQAKKLHDSTKDQTV